MYETRIKIFLTLTIVTALGMVARLVQLQVFRGAEFRQQYEKLLQHTELLPAPRGRILDRTGRILAEDHPCHDLCLDYGFLSGDETWVKKQKRRLAREEKLTSSQADRRYDELAARTWGLVDAAADQACVRLWTDNTGPGVIDLLVDRVGRMQRRTGTVVREQLWAHPIVPGLAGADAGRLRGMLGETVGMEIRPSHRRWYPCNDGACHVIGLIGQVSESEQQRYNAPLDSEAWLDRMRVNYLDGDLIGKRGVEGMCERILRGRRGYRRYRAPGELEEDVPAQPGGDVHLTIDMDLQIELTRLYQRIRAEAVAGAKDPTHRCQNGALVVLDVQTAEVLALVSVPTFNLNTYRRDIASLLAERRDFPLLHRAVNCRYPPGSTVKPIMALAALGAGVINLRTTFHCTGFLFPNDHTKFKCWIGRLGGAHGTLNVTGAIQHSCNVFFYHVGEKLGVRTEVDWLTRFGLAESHTTGLASERRGNLPRTTGRGLARMTAIGQGGVQATPLQMATAIAALARGGEYISPHLVLEGGPKRIRRKFAIGDAEADAVREGMYRVVNDRRGTAWKIFHGSGVEELGFDLCGKTGTAQHPPQWLDLNENGRYDSPGETVYQGDTAWFVGFAPYRNPRVAVAVVCEHAGGGGANAGPIAREVFRVLKRRGYLE